MPRAAILHVGANKSDGFLGPIFEDGRFKYVPISEAYPSSESWTYSELGLKQWVPEDWKYAHYDPEFKTYTWGDYPIIRTHWARKLVNGDYYFFIASLKFHGKAPPRDPQINADWAYYVIGYFVVKEPPLPISYPITGSIRRSFGNNAHVRRKLPGQSDSFLLFSGTDMSYMLDYAVPLSGGVMPNKVARTAMPWINPKSPRWWQGTIEPSGVEYLLEEVKRRNPDCPT